MCKISILSLLALLLLLNACSSQGVRHTLLHLNDTHSHLESVPVNLTVGGAKIKADLGGFARLKTTIDQMRTEEPDLLLLHAGDAVQGTLYFTLFNGSVEFDFLNILGIDAMTFGNHEFDRGTEPIPGWIRRSRFPWLSANIDFSAEPAIAPLVKPYLVKEIQGEKIAIICVTTETTADTSMNVGKARFLDAVKSTREQVAALTSQGISRIILLSHLGYQQDKALAAQVAGVDIIVGGHSHSLLGDPRQLSLIGLSPEGDYPTELKGQDGRRILVLQAWKWGQMLGRIQMTFDQDGEIDSFKGDAVIPVGDQFTRNGVTVHPDTPDYQKIVKSVQDSGIARITAEDPAVVESLAVYSVQLKKYRNNIVAIATDELTVGLNSGPGPLVADSMLTAAPGVQVALLNYGGLRKGLAVGKISVGDIMEMLPFANSLTLVDLTGTELKQSLEHHVDFLINKFGLKSQAMPYLANAIMTVCPSASVGKRITALAIIDQNGRYQPVEPEKVYRTVVNTFVAGGGDGFGVIKRATGFRSDTGVIDSDAFMDYLKKRGTVSNPTEQRITILADETL